MRKSLERGDESMYTVIDEVLRGTGYLKGVAMVVACRFLTTFILREMYYLSEEPPSLLLVARVGRPTRVLTNTYIYLYATRCYFWNNESSTRPTCQTQNSLLFIEYF